MPVPSHTDTERAAAIHEILSREIPDLRPFLKFSSAYELLTAVILSARTTDAGVNRVTPELFHRFPDPPSLAAAPQETVESLVRPLGFFRSKARNIRLAAAKIVADHGGRVPDTMDGLTGLPGVGRKSAGVVLFHIYGKPAVIVDTHFARVVRRLGFTSAADPHRVEMEMTALLPPEIRSSFSMRINKHGRVCCTARKPSCGRCPIAELCPLGPHNR